MGNLNERNKTKYSFGIIAVIGAILVCSPSARVRLQQASTNFQAAQAQRDTARYFKLQTVGGGFMTSDDLKGKVTVVDLWATWCTPCIKEIPIYNRLYESFKGQSVVIVGIAVQSPRRDITSRVRQLDMKYPVLIGDEEALDAFVRVQGFPTTVVLNKEGKICKHYVGAIPNKEQRINQDINDLLVEASGCPAE